MKKDGSTSVLGLRRPHHCPPGERPGVLSSHQLQCLGLEGSRVIYYSSYEESTTDHSETTEGQ